MPLIVSDRTQKAYAKAALRVEAEMDRLNLPRSVENYIHVLTADAPSLTDATWRFKRAAVKWWITINISGEAAEDFSRRFVAARPAVKPKLRLAKGLDEGLQDDLLTVLRHRNAGRYQTLAADLIEAGVATGLRPVEWRSAELVEDRLIVQNAKHRPGISGNGKSRVLILNTEALSTSQREAIERLLYALKNDDWDTIGGHVRRALIRARNALRKAKLITAKQATTRLYDARHQFAANAKMNLDYEGGAVAAAMGHRSAITAHTNYGNRTKGRSGLPVTPTAESVAAVDKRSIERLNRSIAKATGQSAVLPKMSPTPLAPQTPSHTASAETTHTPLPRFPSVG